MWLPPKYRFPGDKVLIKQVGNAVVLLPEQDPWNNWFDSPKQFSADFMDKRSPPEIQDREDIFE